MHQGSADQELKMGVKISRVVGFISKGARNEGSEILPILQPQFSGTFSGGTHKRCTSFSAVIRRRIYGANKVVSADACVCVSHLWGVSVLTPLACKCRTTPVPFPTQLESAPICRLSKLGSRPALQGAKNKKRRIHQHFSDAPRG